MRPAVRFGVAHDFRCPPGSELSLTQVYAETFEQLRVLDGLGLDLVWFSEHHFVEDAYLPNFVPVAAAAAMATSSMRISTDVALAPFAHPLRLAEDMAILDQISNGRMELGLGLGYAPHEFRTFGIPVSRRVSLTEECLDILRLAWSGERFSYHGRRWHFDDVLVTPWPVQPGGPPLWLAVTSEASVDRALRHGTNVLPQGKRQLVVESWRDGVRARGDDPDRYRVGIIRSVLVTDDPERDWPPLRAAERYRMRVYSQFSEDAGTGGKQQFTDTERVPQHVIVGDVDHCVRELVTFISEFGLTDVVTWGSAPGLAPAALTPSMVRFAAEVVPAVRHALA